MGFIVLIPALILFCGGVGFTVLLTASAHRHKRHPGYTLSWIVAGVLSTLSTVFSFVVFALGGVGSDADTGALDFYKTPLGGGFYLYSIDTDHELPLALAHRNDGNVLSQNKQNTVTGLACQAGRVFLRFEEGYGRIDVAERVLVRLAESGLPASASQEAFWTDRQNFSRTPCAEVKVSTSDALRNALALWAGPVLALASLIGLLSWGRRIPSFPQSRRNEGHSDGW